MSELTRARLPTLPQRVFADSAALTRSPWLTDDDCSAMTDAELAPRKKSKMWEQLKKDARQLEGEVEVKLSQYSRLSSGLDSSGAGPSNGMRSVQGASQLHSDITSLLKRLQDVHNAMEVDIAGNDIRHHTVVRHREILQDFSQEFKRMSAQLDQVSFLRSCTIRKV
jgi:hypothetical protein